mmetsp:Transcript_4773/g.12242  ORF Transcript_4773/g.12242 Transcript_4773/m.12242 type:complete len:352 (+) Transcript_4773:88-1143(+)
MPKKPRAAATRPSQPSARVAKNAKKAPKAKRVIPRVKRALDKRAPKLEENPKTLLAMHGTKCSADVKAMLGALVQLQKPLAHQLGRPNQARPFEDPTSVEFLTQKNDATLFAFGSHSKKRPHCLVLGRTYDHHVLDMAEFLVSGLKQTKEFEDKAGFRLNSAPALIFIGADFEHKPDLQVVKNLLQDHFHAPGMELLPSRLPAERVLVFTAHGDSIVSMRHYAIAVGSIDADNVVMAAAAAAAAAKEKGVGLGGEGTRHVSLTEIGPRCDLKLNRTRFADDDLRKDALKRPKSSAAVPTKVKNVTHTALLGKRGKLRIERQDLHQAALKKVKALKTKKGKPEKPQKPKPAE